VPDRLRANGLSSFMFARGVGEQLAQVLQGWREHAAGCQVRLSSLKTVRTLGTGGYGKVVMVQDMRSGELYAMKLQKKDRTTKCAVREAQALERSNHAFIVRLVHIFHTTTFYCLLMELCEMDLNVCILRQPSGQGLPDPSVARYASCIMLALEYIHGHRTVFQDLKPENVLITSMAKGDYAKLADFGLAKSVEAAVRGNSSADSDEDVEAAIGVDSVQGSHQQWSAAAASPPAGTLGFMSSEVLRGKSPDFASTRSASERMRWLASRDWYGLGCCILLMLLGEGGGNKVFVSGRHVLLPPPEDRIFSVLRQAVRDRRIDESAFHLAAALTASSATERANSGMMRESEYLKDAIAELEAVAVHHPLQGSL